MTKCALILVLLYIHSSIERSSNLNTEIISRLKTVKADKSIRFNTNATVLIPGVYMNNNLSYCLWDFSRALRDLVEHVESVKAKTTIALQQLKANVQLLVKENTKTHSACDLKRPKGRNRGLVLQSYISALMKLNRGEK